MKYRKRVPKILEPFIGKKEIVKTIQSVYEKAILDAKLQRAVTIAKSDFKNETIRLLIEEELSDIIKIKADAGGIRYFEAVEMYLQQSKVSKREIENRTYFFQDLFPSLLKYVFQENPKTGDITAFHLNEIARIISKLPSRNHENLKRIDSYRLIEKTLKGEYKNYPKLNVETANKLIKRIRSFVLYGYRTGLFDMKGRIATIKNHYSPRDQRQALSNNEIKILLSNTKNQEIQDFVEILRYSGMRIGELYKFKIVTIDEIECFDLRDAESLKTMSSFRIIPIHSKIKTIAFTYTFEHLSRMVKKLIDKYLKETDKKTTYSLRHTFASELINQNVRTEIISELMGHSHKTMTMNRYVKGYPIKVLKEAIETLE
jgi:integrase/predicted DNA binding CopG/RHH family protein